MQSKKTIIFLVIFSILMSTVTFQTYSFITIIYTLVALTFYLSINPKIDKLFYFICVFVFFVTIGQAYIFNAFNWYNFFGVTIIFLSPYFVYRVTGESHFKIYVQTIYILSIVSLLFWGLQNVSTDFTSVLASISTKLKLDPGSEEGIIIYNIEYSRSALGFIKNAGFVAEGGLFSTLLIPALYLNNIKDTKLFTKVNLVLIFTIITTSSTAGYVALGFFLIMVVLKLKSKFITTLFLPILIFGLYYSVIELPFMYSKVDKLYENEMNVYNTENNPARRGRILSARIDLDLIKENPFFGRGIYSDNRYLNAEEKEIGYSNSYLGIVGLASRYGLVLWFFYLYFLIKFFFRYYRSKNDDSLFETKIFPIFFCLSILAVASGQNPFYMPIYLIMVYAGYDLVMKRKTVIYK